MYLKNLLAFTFITVIFTGCNFFNNKNEEKTYSVSNVPMPQTQNIQKPNQNAPSNIPMPSFESKK